MLRKGERERTRAMLGKPAVTPARSIDSMFAHAIAQSAARFAADQVMPKCCAKD